MLPTDILTRGFFIFASSVSWVPLTQLLTRGGISCSHWVRWSERVSDTLLSLFFIFFPFSVVIGVVVTLLLRVTQTEEKASIVAFFIILRGVRCTDEARARSILLLSSSRSR